MKCAITCEAPPEKYARCFARMIFGYLMLALLRHKIGGGVNSMRYCMANDSCLFSGSFTSRRYRAARGDGGYRPASAKILAFFFSMFCVRWCEVQFAAFWKWCICTGKLNSYPSLLAVLISAAKVGI